MPGQRIDGKTIAKEIRLQAKERVAALQQKGVTPTLAVILVGDDKPSHTYVSKKGAAAEKIGMAFVLKHMPAASSTEEVLAAVHDLQSDAAVSGLIVQLPLPRHVDTNTILNAIEPRIDVDCLTNDNLGKLVMKTNTIVPPTPGAVFSILHSLDVDFPGKNVVIIGVGPLVGKPLAVMLMNERASVTTCNSATKDTKEKCLTADIIVTGVGKKNILTKDMVPKGAIVIDTGVNFEDGKMSGDVDVAGVLEQAAYVTPTPGGVGPITVARLLLNTAILTEQNGA